MSDGEERTRPGSARAKTLAVPKPASTVVLARDRDELEIFLVQRHGSMGFMGGMYVFPGGKVAELDASERMLARVRERATGTQQRRWAGAFDAADSLARAVAAIRETFEEAGVLLASGADPVVLDELRARLHRGEVFAELLEQAGLWLDLELLEPVARWITPEHEPVRFDTTFYLARAPGDQVARHDEHESIAGAWFSPTAALAASASRQIRLAPPTERTLEWFARASSVGAALELARSRPPPTILPIIRELDGELMLLMPGDAEHPVREPAFAGPTRRPLRRS